MQFVAEEAPQAERIGDGQGNAALGVDAEQVAQQQQPEVDAGCQRGASHALGVERTAELLDIRVKAHLGE